MNTGRILGFVIWALLGLLFIILGIYNLFSKAARPFGFWANAETISIDPEKVKPYNRALGKLWIGAGILFIPLGLPFLFSGQNSPWIILSMLGAMLWAIGIMIVYVLGIERKYRKK